VLIVWTIVTSAPAVAARIADSGGPGRMAAHLAALSGQLERNQYGRPIYLESSESQRDVEGEGYALFDYPFAGFSSALQGAADWCDVLMLHVNTKHCRAFETDGRTMLEMGLGGKGEQEQHRMELEYRLARAAPDYFAMQLQAPTGPLATSN